jgi:predicted nucleic acid-binding protein
VSKPSVYIETTVIGYLTSRQQSDAIVAGHQLATPKWWQTARDKFRLVVSQLVIDECARGDQVAAAERVQAISDLNLVGITSDVHRIASALLSRGAVPQTEPKDAAHIAIAASHGVEYLVTWNFRHIANPSARRMIEEVITSAGFTPPIICSPEELSED